MEELQRKTDFFYMESYLKNILIIFRSIRVTLKIYWRMSYSKTFSKYTLGLQKLSNTLLFCVQQKKKTNEYFSIFSLPFPSLKNIIPIN